ncbi:hypothetical protein [Priestia filamentosa]|uniref:hypothetical protein n=1 Tax=Priestia filamentosa TaxID=1402861 RepID=UPI000662160A|nr:hypothetical protein [Priestia filamentosa]WCM14207.1 hypothetical protein PGN40_12700 [Priestia filamentosa]
MTYPSYEEVQNIRSELKEVGYQYWLHHDLFTWQWWVLLIASILPWMIWGYLIKRRTVYIYLRLLCQWVSFQVF